MTNYIYRAQVKGDSITYHNSRGQQVTYKPGTTNSHRRDSSNNKKNVSHILFNAVNKYFTGNSPNITPQEQVQLRADIAKAYAPMSGMYAGHNGDPDTVLDVYEGIDFVLKTFSDEASEGGKNITPNEVYQMYEIFHQWTK